MSRSVGVVAIDDDEDDVMYHLTAIDNGHRSGECALIDSMLFRLTSPLFSPFESKTHFMTLH